VDEISQCKYACLTEEDRISAFARAMRVVYVALLGLHFFGSSGLVSVHGLSVAFEIPGFRE
jgi:hypothetical protein